VIADPLLAGATQVNVSIVVESVPIVTVGAAGAAGTVNAVTALEDNEVAEDIPGPDCLTIEKVYAVPAVSTPEAKDIGDTEALDVNPPGEDVAT
jgi:hypothetical protein